jgi:hypothetical protein
MRHLIFILLLTQVLSSSSSSSSSSLSSPYDDLVRCMWNGTNVGSCHSLDCLWCHSNFADICVTPLYAKSLNGTIFHCERHHVDADDDAVTALPTPSPTSSLDDDDDDDDDPNHDANAAYMKRLLHCLSVPGGPTECSNDDQCIWCDTTTPKPSLRGAVDLGRCMSHAAAKNMDGNYYHCRWESNESGIVAKDYSQQFLQWIRIL